MRRSAIVALAISAACTITASAAGCARGDDAAPPTGTAPPATTQSEGTRLTSEQASVLSQVLARNWEAGGTTIDARIPFGSATFTVHADIDFVQGHARGTMTTTYTDGQPPEKAEIAWTPQQVALDTGDGWQQRAMDPRQHPLDQVLSVIGALASEQRDNPALLRQGPARFLRRDQVAGVPVDVYAYGDRTTWFVDADGRLVRVEATTPTTTGTITIDLSAPGPRSITLP